jgi:hypothetical protein
VGALPGHARSATADPASQGAHERCPLSGPELAIDPVPNGVNAELMVVLDRQPTGFTLNEWDGCQSGLSSSGLCTAGLSSTDGGEDSHSGLTELAARCRARLAEL